MKTQKTNIFSIDSRTNYFHNDGKKDRIFRTSLFPNSKQLKKCILFEVIHVHFFFKWKAPYTSEFEKCVKLSRSLCYDSCSINWLVHFCVRIASKSMILWKREMNSFEYLPKQWLSMTAGVNKCLRCLIVTFITVIY